MNRVVTSALVMGAGVAAYSYMQRNGMMNRRQMKQLQKRMAKLF
ncbi:YrzQ family protein [Mesobacillus campisalis]|nr:YrzQ family protein [Mesobacillus campisalis]